MSEMENNEEDDYPFVYDVIYTAILMIIGVLMIILVG